jgi:1,4-alpha-glucan branching enzyme
MGERVELTRIRWMTRGQNTMTTKERAPAMTHIPAGATDQGNGRVTFGLYAPWKISVHLMGDFNGWSRTGLPMQVNDEGMWTAQIDLKPGEFAYQFVIDAGAETETVIADPYSRKLRHVEGRPEPHSLIEVGGKPFVWNDAGFGIKPLNELVIYELHVGDFSPEGTFKGVTDRLDYIRDLGVSAIELMPVQEFPGDRSWGYNPAFFFCPESSYGDAGDLKALVDGAHQRGIGIILDVVFNHTDASNPLTRLYPYQDSPYFGQEGNPWGFPDFNHWSDATKRLMRDIQDYWLMEFHVDGFRYDHSEGIGWDAENGMNYIAWAARQTKPHVYLIAENLNDQAGVVHNTHVDASWHESFHGIVRAQLREGDYQGRPHGDMQALLAEMTFAAAGYADNAQAINYIENHDQERVASEVRTNPALDIDQAVNAKSKLGAMVLFTAAGVPMLYAGQEFGMSTPKTVDTNKLQWARLDDPTWRDLRDFHASMARLRAQNRALQLNSLEPLLVDSERRVLVFKRWDEGGNQVVVGLNFSPAQQFVEVDFPRAGTWHEWTKDYDEMLGSETRFTAELPPSGGKIWVAI